MLSNTLFRPWPFGPKRSLTLRDFARSTEGPPATNERQRHEKQSKACTMREQAEGVLAARRSAIQLRAASFLSEH
jgi:hypothetical protein